MAEAETDPAVLPIVEERAIVDKHTVETGRVSVRTRVEAFDAAVSEDLARHEAAIERVPVDREVDVAPEPRWEGEVLIVPVVEEFLVVEKRLRLVEELRVTSRRTVERVETAVPLRRTRVEVDREAEPAAPPSS